MDFVIREAEESDLKSMFLLYTQLHNNLVPQNNEKINMLWHSILNDKNHHIILGCLGEKIISSCVVVVVPNLTHSQRPYALVENVITDENYRNKGYASAILNYAKEIALNENCYKIMLMTGSKNDSTLNFYRKAGYNAEDKTAFIQWL